MLATVCCMYSKSRPLVSITLLSLQQLLFKPYKRMSSSKAHAATILELTMAYDEAKNKRYKKGKFLGKVCTYIIYIVFSICVNE